MTQVPMREKYVDEAIGIYFEFGTSGAEGTVDVNDGQRDIFTSLPKDVAQKVIAAHTEFRFKLYEILCH